MLNLKYAEVKRFNRAAAAHLDAARSLFSQCPAKGMSTRGHDVVYLSGYVVECVLKALLLSRSPEKHHAIVIRKLKEEVGHNLEKLKVELVQKGVVFSREQNENFKRVRPAGHRRCDTTFVPGSGRRSITCF